MRFSANLKNLTVLSVAISVFILAITASNANSTQDGEFQRLYDAYCYLASKGEVDKLAALRTAAIEKSIREQTMNKNGRAFFASNAKLQVPDSYNVLHIHKNRDRVSATMYVLAKYPPIPKFERPAMTIEMAINYKFENDLWKLGEIRPMSDPSKVKRPKDLTFDPRDADTETTGNIFGRVVSIEYKPDHVLVILRVMDEEIAVFMPEKNLLEKKGVNFEELAPWNMQQFSGHPHKKDDLKFFATGNSLIED